MSNKLAKEKSPYLLQHKDNPVNWYSWSEEAFDLAKQQNKPIFLSIGYSTCYWCHMMEKDSFEKEDVAAILNQYFVAIKVDREERPDVDKIYMDVVVALTGHGGWPMSVFLTPELKPFWGGTFFYREQFKRILQSINNTWSVDREKILLSAGEIVSFFKQRAESELSDRKVQHNWRKLHQQAVTSLAERFDLVNGGFGTEPKFPPTQQLLFLLQTGALRGDQEALKMANLTLEKMYRGGIFDYVAGGFHRYATDAAWKIPHYEKMLYDNAQLLRVYLEAFRITGDAVYREAADRVFNYLNRQMLGDGGYFAAEDAGDVGKEGEYYEWSDTELSKLLTASELEIFDKKVFDQTVVDKLKTEREKRKAPHKDQKIITSWNGLLLIALARGNQILLDERYLTQAKAVFQFVKEKLWNGDELFRSYCDGEVSSAGTLEDYAFLINGIVELSRAGQDLELLKFALILQKKQQQLFWVKEKSAYRDSAAKELFVDTFEFADGVTPATNAVSLLNLFALADVCREPWVEECLAALTTRIAIESEKSPSNYSTFLVALPALSRENAVFVCTGDSCSISSNNTKP